MKISDFSFDVPPELIALAPVQPRSAAKLLVWNREKASIVHSSFENLTEFLKAGDLIVFNNTFVIPARFFGRRSTGGQIEGLLMQTPAEKARVWLKGRALAGEEIEIDGFRTVRVLSRDGRQAELDCSCDELAAHLKECGHIPLPPYIVSERNRRQWKSNEMALDFSEYQSVFAKESRGFSVAAPTASLHFNAELLRSLKQKGIETAEITLHVGEGTFALVEVEELAEHRMHFEEVSISQSVWEKILATKKAGGRVVGVGTTVCRSLESAAIRAERGLARDTFSTNLFIKPPFEFRVLDALVTNFHWPDSTLIVLVATFLEAKSAKSSSDFKHLWRRIYDEAISKKYRLFSYGDGMLIL